MIEVKKRSSETWGPLANISDEQFTNIIDNRRGSTKDLIKAEAKRVKKLKTFRVTYKKCWYSDTFVIQAENEYDISRAARDYFKQNGDKIEFEKKRDQWAGSYNGFDSISYVKVRS